MEGTDPGGQVIIHRNFMSGEAKNDTIVLNKSEAKELEEFLYHVNREWEE
jgi:hypothetical protein